MKHSSSMKWIFIAMTTALALTDATSAAARPRQDSAKAAYDALQDLIYDERYSQAYDAAERFVVEYGDSRWVESAEFWRCYALQRSTRDYGKAFDCYARYLDVHPEGKWADDARSEYLKLAKRLSDAGDPRGKAALEGLAAKGRTDEGEFKLTVLWALMDSGEGEVPLEMVNDLLRTSNDADVRRNVVYLISDMDDPRVLKTLIHVAKTDPDPDIRRHAIYALSEHAEEEEVIDAMVEIMKTEKDADIRRHVLYAIAETEREDVTSILVNVARTDPDEDARRAATYALVEVESPEATAALESIVETAESDDLRIAALYALIEREDANILPTLKKIALTEPATRAGGDLQKAAVYALAEVDDPTVVPVLAEIVKTSDDRDVRVAAFYALAEHGGDEAESVLRTAALDSRDADLAKAAVYALTDFLEDEDATEFFMEVYRKSPFDEVRKAALYAAMSSAGDASAPALGHLLDAQEDPDQRETIVWALAEIESEESVAILARVAKTDADKGVRRAAVQALGAMGTPSAKKALRDLLNER